MEIKRYEEIIEYKKAIEDLQKTDYLALKYAEGLISDVEYSEIKQKREQMREKVNELRKKLPKDYESR